MHTPCVVLRRGSVHLVEGDDQSGMGVVGDSNIDIRLRQRKAASASGSRLLAADSSVERPKNVTPIGGKSLSKPWLVRVPILWCTIMNTTTTSSTLVLFSKIVCASCALWILLFLLIGGTATAKDLYASLFPVKDKAGVAMIGLVLPTLIAATFAALSAIRNHHHSESTPSSSLSVADSLFRDGDAQPSHQASSRGRLGLVLRRYCRPGGDPDFRQWGIVAIVMPCLVYACFCIYRKGFSEDGISTAKAVAESGNACGITALIAMSILMIPVARHGSLLQLWGWNPAAAIRLHICAGRVVMIMVLLHGGCHLFRWAFLLHEDVVSLFIIPLQCWTNEKTYKPKCWSNMTDCSCYAHKRNVTGLVAAIALLVISVSTLNVVRRRLYTVFYKIHILAGPTVLIFTVLHWNRSIIYLAGAVLYYVACSFPVWIEQWRKQRCGQSGVRVVSVERIDSGSDNSTNTATKSESDRPCVAITVAASDMATRRYRAGQYVKLSCPSLSSISHPFTINIVPCQSRQLRLIVRCTGPFTSKLASHMTAALANDSVITTATTPSPSPIIHLDGFHGCPSRMEQVLQHDVVVFVAGGVGITPYLSLLHKVLTLPLGGRGSTTRRVVLHWTCRDPALIAFVQREYIDPLVASIDDDSVPSNRIQLQIVIHRTGRAMSNKSQGENNRTTVSSYTDLENPQDCVVEDQVKDASCITPSSQEGSMPFTPSRYSHGSKTSIKGNTASFLSFSLIVWAGLIGVWYLYRTYPAKLSIFPRLLAPVFIIVLGLGVGLVAHWLCAESALSRYWGDDNVGDDKDALWEPIVGENSVGGSIVRSSSLELGDLNASSDLDLSVSVGDTHSNESDDGRGDNDDIPRVKVEERDGRPTVYRFLNSFDGSRSPGLFACGPVSLLNDIRRATNERCLLRARQCIRGEPNIALYEEAFEM